MGPSAAAYQSLDALQSALDVIKGGEAAGSLGRVVEEVEEVEEVAEVEEVVREDARFPKLERGDG